MTNEITDPIVAKILGIKMKGKGGLTNCPSCGSDDIDAFDRDFVDAETMIQYVSCKKCGKNFSELWKVVDWEEEE